jgi:hypothetical protein
LQVKIEAEVKTTNLYQNSDQWAVIRKDKTVVRRQSQHGEAASAQAGTDLRKQRTEGRF